MVEVQAAREAVFTPLLDLLEKRQHLQRQLADLDEPYGRAFAAAEAAGWATDELLAIGADEPVRRPKGRPRGRRGALRNAGQEAAASLISSERLGNAMPVQDRKDASV